MVIDHPDKQFIIISNNILDITAFERAHPGGARYIKVIAGAEGTHEFYGSLHRHSDEANKLASQMKFARLVDETSKET